MSSCLDLEIGLTEAALANLRHRGLPDVDEWTYSAYSRIEMGGDGRSRGFGYPTASWSWQFLSQWQVDVLLSFFSAAGDASVSLYITTYIDTGRGKTTETYQAVMHRPVDGSGKSMITESRTPIYSDVSVQFTRLETP
jgi:hypothetical protein